MRYGGWGCIYETALYIAHIFSNFDFYCFYICICKLAQVLISYFSINVYVTFSIEKLFFFIGSLMLRSAFCGRNFILLYFFCLVFVWCESVKRKFVVSTVGFRLKKYCFKDCLLSPPYLILRDQNVIKKNVICSHLNCASQCGKKHLLSVHMTFHLCRRRVPRSNPIFKRPTYTRMWCVKVFSYMCWIWLDWISPLCMYMYELNAYTCNSSANYFRQLLMA